MDPFVKSEKSLHGYHAIVTGGNSGIGYETAKELAKKGAKVVIACRNEKRGKRAEKEINKSLKILQKKGGKISFMLCDLGDLKSTREFVENYKSLNIPLHILINNAGFGGTSTFKTSKDNFEVAWVVNYLSHFLLTYSFMPLLIDSMKSLNSSQKKGKEIGRIINVSSDWHKYGEIDFKSICSNISQQKMDANSHGEGYSQTEMYGRSKLAQIMHATYCQKEVISKYNLPLSFMSCHPGGVYTGIFKISRRPLHHRLLAKLLYPFIRIFLRSPFAGAQVIICSFFLLLSFPPFFF